MKSFFKRSVISIVVLGMAGSSYAAMSHMSNSNNAGWAPRFTGFFIGVDGLDLRAQNGDLDYITYSPNFTPGSFSTSAVSTSYQWNWRIYGGIKFTDNDDITVSWMSLKNNNSDSVVIPSGTTTALRWLDQQATWSSASASADFTLNDGYLVWGHTVNFNNPWSVRYAAGVEYVKLDADLDVTGASSSSTVILAYEGDSHTQGWGPRVEFDATYHLPYNFALFANTNAALLASTRKISLDAALDTNTTTTPNIFSSYFDTRHVIIPRLGMRLGASYSLVWGQAGGEGASCSALTLDVGWQADAFIHAIERPEDGYINSTTTSVMAETKTSNFTDQGWFIGLKFSSDWL